MKGFSLVYCRWIEQVVSWGSVGVRPVSVGVLFALNRLPHRHFWWYGSVFKKREKKWVSSRWRWNSLGTINIYLWVMKLNVYETMEWNFVLRVGVSSKFHFILCHMAVLEIMPWNYPLRLALKWMRKLGITFRLGKGLGREILSHLFFLI